MADMHRGIKRVLQTHPADALMLAVPGAEILGMLPIDVATEPQLTLDMLLCLPYQDMECAVDLGSA